MKLEHQKVASEFSLTKVRTEIGINYPDINIRAGEITFISGESGCGKSTFLSLLNGTRDDYQGTIHYKGGDLRTYDPLTLRQDVLLVSQSTYLFGGTIMENFAIFYGYRNLPTPSAETMECYLKLCSIFMPLSTHCQNLSGGEKQRVYLAIFLSFGAQTFLLDEPTAALDDQNAHTILSNICQFCVNKNITLVVVSHNIALAEKFAMNNIFLGASHE